MRNTAVKLLTEKFLDLLFPSRCPVCGRILAPDEHMICRKCRKDLPWVREPVCQRCGKPISDPERAYCADCARVDHMYTEGRSALLYEKGVRLSVSRMKFYNHREYIPFYAACLLRAGRPYLASWRVRCIIPIPMHPRKRAERGFDQTVLLARQLSGLSGIPVLEDCLIRVRYTKASRKLGREHRLKNLRGAFQVRKGRKIPQPVLLLDDIYTTGTTMDYAAGALRAAGVKEIFFLTLCTGRGAE